MRKVAVDMVTSIPVMYFVTVPVVIIILEML